MKHTTCGNARVRWPAWLVVLLLVGACSVTGTWKRVETEPPDAPFPVDDLRLDADGNYGAQWDYEGRTYGSYGTYKFRGGELIIAQAGSVPRAYGARLRLDGKLELTYTVNEDSIKAVLERQRSATKQPNERPEQPETRPAENGATPANPTGTRDGNAGQATDQP